VAESLTLSSDASSLTAALRPSTGVEGETDLVLAVSFQDNGVARVRITEKFERWQVNPWLLSQYSSSIINLCYFVAASRGSSAKRHASWAGTETPRLISSLAFFSARPTC
jgi:hypothetical protein